jgi:beta-glucanase (GH16 family)
MLSNKFCFTGGILLNSVTLPGTTNVLGLSPAVWAMGNLGHAGYGASLDGMWPYSYDTCDVGTLPNQTLPDNSGPQAALDTGGDNKDAGLSFLPGQRLSACTCAVRFLFFCLHRAARFYLLFLLSRSSSHFLRNSNAKRC